MGHMDLELKPSIILGTEFGMLMGLATVAFLGSGVSGLELGLSNAALHVGHSGVEGFYPLLL